MAVTELCVYVCVYQYTHAWCPHTLDKNRTVHQKYENWELHCSHLKKAQISTVTRVQEEKHVYLLFLLLAISKNLMFLLVVAGTLGQEEARRGKRKMALITGKRGQ